MDCCLALVRNLNTLPSPLHETTLLNLAYYHMKGRVLISLENPHRVLRKVYEVEEIGQWIFLCLFDGYHGVVNVRKNQKKPVTVYLL